MCAVAAATSKPTHLYSSSLLHACAGVMNRDIKLQNTLLSPQPAGVPPMVKLCDFGYSKHEDFDSVAKSCVGTPAYIAPGKPRSRDLDVMP